MQRAGPIQADVVTVRLAVRSRTVRRRRKPDVLAGCAKLAKKIRQPHAFPIHHSAPAFDALEFGRDFVSGQLFDRTKRNVSIGIAGDMHGPIVERRRAHQPHMAVHSRFERHRRRKFRRQPLRVEILLGHAFIEFQNAPQRPRYAVFRLARGQPSDSGCPRQRRDGAKRKTATSEPANLSFDRGLWHGLTWNGNLLIHLTRDDDLLIHEIPLSTK